jgi:hypothetical protein
VYISVFVYPLAAYHYLSRGARSTFDSFRPATRLSDAAAARLKLELATTPARPVLLMWLSAAMFDLASVFADAFKYKDLTPAYAAIRVTSEGLWVGPILFVLAYLVFRQGRLVARLHQTVEHVDLLRPEPLHAMARLTARSSIALVVVVVFAGLPLPGNEGSYLFTILVFCLPVLVIALGAFFVPLRGMNQALVHEKRRLLDEVSTRIESASQGLHRLVDQEAGNESDADASRLAQTRMDALTKALAGVIAERDFIKRLSTWPWDSTTLRAVLSAIALPLILFAVTRLLERVI